MLLSLMLVASFHWNKKAKSFETLKFCGILAFSEMHVLITFRNLVVVKFGSDVVMLSLF